MRTLRLTFLFVLVALVALPAAGVWADGTETLGPPSIGIASGSGIVAAGTGLRSQPGSINITVPAGATIQQVLLYWEGQHEQGSPGHNAIQVNGNSIPGVLIGGPTTFFESSAGYRVDSSTYRADITSLGVVSAGANTLGVAGLAYNHLNNGAGVLVIYDDGTLADVQVRDGNDLAYATFSDPLDTTVAQTFAFAACTQDRTAHLEMFFSSVRGADDDYTLRPSVIVVVTNGTETLYINRLDSLDGDEWDTLHVDVNIPAGATTLTVQALSEDRTPSEGGQPESLKPASFAWNAAALSLPVPPPPPPPPGCGTPGFWKNHPDAWPVEEITIGGMTYTKADAIGLMDAPEKGDKTYSMFRALVAAKLNVLAGNPDGCIAGTIADADAWMATNGPAGSGVKAGGRDSAWRDGEPIATALDDYNNGYLCAPPRD